MTLRILQLQKQIVSNQDNLLSKYKDLTTIDVPELKSVFYDPNLAIRQGFFDIVIKNRDIFTHSHLEELTRKQQRSKTAQLLLHYSKNKLFTEEEYYKDPNKISSLTSALYTYYPGFAIKYGVHMNLYHKAIFNLGTTAHKQFLTRAFQFKDIGCFGLTQLLHGSNVRGIQTEAHYDHVNKEFIIHSPSKDAMKFWIGAAANLANMSVIWAQLYIDGKCYGVHAYIVPIRDLKTHDVLPGVTIGDCGPKVGKNSIDNGFIMFDKVRIPKINQLNRLAGVDQNGKYFSQYPTSDKTFGMQMGVLSGGRFLITLASNTITINSLAIAIRYTLCRRQFSPPKSNIETFLFQYPLTKYRLVPLLAQIVIYQFGSRQLGGVWDSNTHNLLDPKNKLIQQLHGISSVIKPQASWFAARVVSECRQMLGGHGYSAYSRLGALQKDNDVNMTWQGDNNVLLQQTAKYLLDNMRKLMSGKQITAESIKFLESPPIIEGITIEKLKCTDFIERIFQSRVYEKIRETSERLFELKSTGNSDYQVWNKSQVYYAHPLALSYGDLCFIQSAKKSIKRMKNENNKRVASDCLRLFAWRCLQAEGYGDESTRKSIKSLILEYCQILSKEVVGLLAALAAPSEVIGSPFADQDGNGMKKYLNLLYTGKDTFRKVEWYNLLTNRQR